MFTKQSERILFLISAVLTAAASADIIYVDAKRPQQDANGNCWCSAYPTLQEALDNSAAGDEIWVARFFLEDGVTPGAYKPSATYPNPPSDTDRSKTFYIKPGVQVYGGFRGADAELFECDADAPALCDRDPNPSAYPGETLRSDRNPELNITVLDGDIGLAGVETDNSYHVVYFQGNNPDHETKLSGFIVRNGRADGAPGSQQDQAGDDHGAGIMVHWGENNDTGPILNRLNIRDNYALHGGAGIHVFGKTDTYAANLWIENNVVESGRGAGVLVERGGIYLQNGVFYKNRCIIGPGGGLAIAREGHSQQATLTNCTFYGNLAPEPSPNEVLTAGAVFCDLIDVPAVAIRNSIAWNNSPPQIESWLSLSVSVTFSDVEDGPWSSLDPSNIMLDPFFHHAETATPANGRLRVRLCSPVIDLGNDDLIQSDVTDVDDGGAPGPIPWDYKKFDRVIPPGPPPTGDPGYVDFGSYEECPGDIDGNGRVDISDLSELLSCFGASACESTNPGCCRCDIQGCNSAVDISDLSLLLSLFGTTCEPTLGLDGPSAEATMLAEDPMTQWIRSATPEEVLDWWYAGMPPVDGSYR